MRISAAITETRDKAYGELVGIALAGCLLALAAGALAATDHGVLIAGGMVGLAFCGLAIVLYIHDPVLALIGLWFFEVFNGSLSAAVGYHTSAGAAVRQADEVLVVLLLGLTIWHGARTNARLPPVRFVLPGVAIALLGTLSAILHQVPFTVTAVGAWLGLKFWLMVGITLMLPWKANDINRVYRVFTVLGLFIAVLGLADYLTHSAVSRTLHTSVEEPFSKGFRAEAVHSILPHPGEYSLLMSMLFAVTFSRFTSKHSRSDLIYALLFAGSAMLSLRLKGVLSLAAVALIVALVQGASSNHGGVTALLVGGLLIVGVYSIEGNVIARQISMYTSSETSARGQLYSVGERIASDNFPFGAGFGRFASYPSRIYYSPLYYKYELSSIYGLSQKFPNYIDDTSWPSVIGETGYVGFIIFLGGIIFIVLALIRRLRTATATNKWVPLSGLCAMAVLLIDSLGDPTLFDWLAITGFAMILGPALAAARSTSEGHAVRHPVSTTQKMADRHQLSQVATTGGRA